MKLTQVKRWLGGERYIPSRRSVKLSVEGTADQDGLPAAVPFKAGPAQARRLAAMILQINQSGTVGTPASVETEVSMSAGSISRRFAHSTRFCGR